MISLSSIVKANLSYDMPQSMEFNRIKNNYYSMEQERLTNEINEKRDSILRQAVKKAQQIEADALKRSAMLIEHARQNSEDILKKAQQKGYEDGYLSGLVEGAKASEAAAEEGLENIKNLLECAKEEQEKAIKRHEKDLIAISLEAARKIMRQQVKIDENVIPGMLDEIVHENQTGLKIYISEYQPTLDLHINRTLAKKLRDRFKDSRIVFLKEEDQIMIETENGILDISVPVQMSQIKQALNNE